MHFGKQGLGLADLVLYYLVIDGAQLGLRFLSVGAAHIDGLVPFELQKFLVLRL